MTTISVVVINPKANKLLKELEHLGLIKLNPLKKEKKEDFYISESMLQILDKEYIDYMNGKGKNYSREEVMSKFKR
ncbi:MAG: hypothetical protein ACOYLG_08185 [Chitinophagaceae bacterium]|jgi:hypothetical protein